MFQRILFAVFFSLILSLGANAQETTDTPEEETAAAPAWQPDPAHNTILDEITSAVGNSACCDNGYLQCVNYLRNKAHGGVLTDVTA